MWRLAIPWWRHWLAAWEGLRKRSVCGAPNLLPSRRQWFCSGSAFSAPCGAAVAIAHAEADEIVMYWYHCAAVPTSACMHLLHVINSSIVNWKIITIVPIDKGDDAKRCNYRPISILLDVTRLCALTVCTKLTQYVLSLHIISRQQYGFRPDLSTKAAVLAWAVVYATSNVDKDMMISLVTADTSKAFDSVEHCLVEKLGWYCIDNQWFAAWFSNGMQYVDHS